MTGRMALAAALFFAGAATARAQQPACAAAPEAPDRVTAKVDAAIDGGSSGTFTPAVLTLSWRPPAEDRRRPGRLPSAYVIEAGSDRGRSDVAVVRTAGPELAFTTPMANGTYYLRVRSVNACGTSRPSRESRVRIRDSVETDRPNPLVVLSTVHATTERLGDRVYVRVFGQVRNGWRAAPAAFVTVTASFEGSRGELGVVRTAYVNGTARRLTHSRLVTDTILEPGATGCFLIFAEFPTGQVSSLGLVAAGEAFATEPLAGRVELEGALTLAPDPFDDLLISGRLKNAGDRPARFSEIWVEVRDERGEVLDCRAAPVQGETLQIEEGLATRTGLAAGQIGPFSNATEAVYSMVRAVRQWITWDEAEEGERPTATDQYLALRKQVTAALEGDTQATSPQEVAQARDALRRESQAIEQRLAADRR